MIFILVEKERKKLLSYFEKQRCLHYLDFFNTVWIGALMKREICVSIGRVNFYEKCRR